MSEPIYRPATGADRDELARFLVYGQTVTSIVVSTPVQARGLPLDSGPR